GTDTAQVVVTDCPEWTTRKVAGDLAVAFQPAGTVSDSTASRTSSVAPLVNVVVTDSVVPPRAEPGALTFVNRGPEVRSTRKPPDSGRFRDESPMWTVYLPTPSVQAWASALQDEAAWGEGSDD